MTNSKPLRFLSTAAAIVAAANRGEIAQVDVAPADGGLFDVRAYWTAEEKWTARIRVSAAQRRRIVGAML